MTELNMRGFARAFCDALAHDADQLATWLDDDIDWLVFGPIDLFPFFGPRRGKEAVLTACRQFETLFEIRQCEKDSVLVDGEQAASMLRITAIHRQTERIMSMRLSYFAQFRAGKVVRLRALLDSFDFAEQALGREIDLSAAA